MRVAFRKGKDRHGAGCRLASGPPGRSLGRRGVAHGEAASPGQVSPLGGETTFSDAFGHVNSIILFFQQKVIERRLRRPQKGPWWPV